jgi:hypothetical protein
MDYLSVMKSREEAEYLKWKSSLPTRVLVSDVLSVVITFEGGLPIYLSDAVYPPEFSPVQNLFSIKFMQLDESRVGQTTQKQPMEIALLHSEYFIIAGESTVFVEFSKINV